LGNEPARDDECDDGQPVLNWYGVAGCKMQTEVQDTLRQIKEYGTGVRGETDRRSPHTASFNRLASLEVICLIYTGDGLSSLARSIVLLSTNFPRSNQMHTAPRCHMPMPFAIKNLLLFLQTTMRIFNWSPLTMASFLPSNSSTSQLALK